MYMYSYYFIIPKAVYFCCILPALIIIVASVLFGVVYRQKKGTKYYAYTLNYVYTIASMLICLLLFPLLLGYCVAMLTIINKGLLLEISLLVKILLIMLPTIPFITLIFVLYKFIKNLELKNKIDNDVDTDTEVNKIS